MKKDIGKYIFLCCLILTGVGTFLARSLLQKQERTIIQAKNETGIPNKRTDLVSQPEIEHSGATVEKEVEVEVEQEQVRKKKSFQKMPDQYLDGNSECYKPKYRSEEVQAEI